MKSIDKTIKYYELLMKYEDTSKVLKYELGEGYHFEFYKDGDEYEWINIHMSTGEFVSVKEELRIFEDFFGSFKSELNKRCFFIVTNDGEKVGTATASLLKEPVDDINATVDWVAIKKEYQGKHLSKPLITFLLNQLYKLGHTKTLLHTQTHTWLAAKIYLDLGFVPYETEENIEGWRILKTLTNHPLLSDFESVEETSIYSKTAIDIYNKLQEMHGNNFNYEIWYKNGMHDVWVNDGKNYFEYKYAYVNDAIQLTKL